jgi:ABC-2 type transport system ATP-binding protein
VTLAELTGVDKRFGPQVALAAFDLAVPEGEITVLVGPNGAGKTTALRVITGALPPDAGQVTVFGFDPATFGFEIRRRCGVVTAKPSLYDRLSGLDNLLYAAELYGVGDGPHVIEAAGRFGIADALDQQVGGYSTGMKTRLALARAVLHDPELLLLDEPTSGLDPESSHAVLDLIRQMTASRKTVVMCTHLLLEAEGLADQLVVLQDGTAAVAGSPDELAREHWPATAVRVEANFDPGTLHAAVDRLGLPVVERVGDAVVIEVDSMAAIPDLIDRLRAEGVGLTRVDPRKPSLEELYFAIRKVGATPGRP